MLVSNGVGCKYEKCESLRAWAPEVFVGGIAQKASLLQKPRACRDGDSLRFGQMKLQNSILIRAPQDVVWKATEDIARWPEWTPTVESMERLDEGTFKVGSAAYIKQPGLPRSKWVVTEMDRGRHFTWECTVLSMRMRATHALSACESGTQNTLRLEMTGVVAVLLWPLLYFAVKRTLQQENSGLKAWCEQLTNVQS